MSQIIPCLHITDLVHCSFACNLLMFLQARNQRGTCSRVNPEPIFSELSWLVRLEKNVSTAETERLQKHRPID